MDAEDDVLLVGADVREDLRVRWLQRQVVAQAVELDLSAYEGRWPEEMLGRTRFPRIGELPYLLTLAPRGWFWFLLKEDPDEDMELTDAKR